MAKKSRSFPHIMLGRAQLAQALGVSVGSIPAMVSDGMLPPPRQWGSRLLWIVSEVEQAVADWPVSSTYGLGYAAPDAGNGWDVAHVRHDPSGAIPPLDGWQSMTADDWEAAKGRWREEVLKSPLNKRERGALRQLAIYGIGVPVAHSNIKDCGPDTMERLGLRGYMVAHYRPEAPDRLGHYILTEAGMAAYTVIMPPQAS